MEKQTKAWYKKWWGILLLCLLVLFLASTLAIGYYIINIIKTESLDINKGSKNLYNQDLITGDSSNYWLGSSNPKITIIEFADFACFYCKESFPKIREISNTYKDDVKIIFRDFPVISESSADLALAARCAGEQGLFWVMHDKLFLNQGVEDMKNLFELANQIGANTDRFNKCYTSKKYLANIQKDYDDALTLGLTGTPVWFINGERIDGNIPRDTFIKIIEDLLK